MRRQIRFSIWFSIVLVAAFAAGYLFWQQTLLPGPYDVEPMVVVENRNAGVDTSGWQTYIYKNLSFKYPNGWTVVFDSEVTGQPNGFTLHVMRTGDGGFQPDELSLSSFNDRINTSADYIQNENRAFTLNQNRDSYIWFTISRVAVYAGCGYYSRGQATLDICNKIVSTATLDDVSN